jgi:hypothetical protein
MASYLVQHRDNFLTVREYVYPKVSGLEGRSEYCKWYSSLPLGAFYRYFVSQSSECCRHNTLNGTATSNTKGKHIFRYGLNPETSGYTRVPLPYHHSGTSFSSSRRRSWLPGRILLEMCNSIHTSPQLAPILGHMNPVHFLPTYFSKICSLLSSHLRLSLPSELFPLGLATKVL